MKNHLEMQVVPVFFWDFFLEAGGGLCGCFGVANAEAVCDSVNVCVDGECRFVENLGEDDLGCFFSDSRECGEPFECVWDRFVSEFFCGCEDVFRFGFVKSAWLDYIGDLVLAEGGDFFFKKLFRYAVYH